jgi:hypothetical protein
MFFVCFVRRIQKLVLELRQTEKKNFFFKIKKKNRKKKKSIIFFGKRISQTVFWINYGSGEHEEKFLEVERGRKR